MNNTTLRIYDGYPHTTPHLKSEIRELQQVLGEADSSISIDGFFGPNTEEAVEQFQQARSLTVDGIVGPRTWAALLGQEVPPRGRYFETTIPKYNSAMLEELSEVERYIGYIEATSEVAGVSPAIICGIGSRESRWGISSYLDVRGPGGTGDTIKRRGKLPPDGRGYGRGLMQIDYNAHEFARTGDWSIAAENIRYGGEVLRGSIAYLAKKLGDDQHHLGLRAGIAGYNCGPGNVSKALRLRRDVDYYTHGRNYSADVLNRAGWFQMQDIG